MPDFWSLSGHHLLDARDDGLLGVNDEFLRAFFQRPEMRLEPDSCPAERALHAALLDDPRRAVADGEIDALADEDARDNWRVVLSFRDRLLAAGTVEACYLTLFRDPDGMTPPLFIDQMAHVILRGLLDGGDDPLRVRAAELFFRSQKVSLSEGGVLMADQETVDMKRDTAGLGNLGRLLVEMETPLDESQIDVLTADNAGLYWARSDRYDMVFDASIGQPGLAALCRVMEAWILHMLGVETTIEPVPEIKDDHWVWHIGLDAEANAILNDLYQGVALDDERARQIVALFTLEFASDAIVRPEIAGRRVYLG
ncbi:MAG: DUF6352 family protein, partial [Alphaproteobacteria bacterium]